MRVAASYTLTNAQCLRQPSASQLLEASCQARCISGLQVDVCLGNHATKIAFLGPEISLGLRTITRFECCIMYAVNIVHGQLLQMTGLDKTVLPLWHQKAHGQVLQLDQCCNRRDQRDEGEVEDEGVGEPGGRCEEEPEPHRRRERSPV